MSLYSKFSAEDFIECDDKSAYLQTINKIHSANPESEDDIDPDLLIAVVWRAFKFSKHPSADQDNFLKQSIRFTETQIRKPYQAELVLDAAKDYIEHILFESRRRSLFTNEANELCLAINIAQIAFTKFPGHPAANELLPNLKRIFSSFDEKDALGDLAHEFHQQIIETRELPDLVQARNSFNNLKTSDTVENDVQKITDFIIKNDLPFVALYSDNTKTTYDAIERLEKCASGSALKIAQNCYKILASFKEETETKFLVENMRTALLVSKKNYAALDATGKNSDDTMIGLVFNHLLKAVERREMKEEKNDKGPTRGGFIVIPIPKDFQP